MDHLAQKIILILSSLLFLIMAGIFYGLGINESSLTINLLLLLIGAYVLFFANTPLRANHYRKLETQWSTNAQHTEYPRPQLEREQWINLNGSWHYAIRPKQSEMPTSFDGRIEVPFPLESDLSGVARKIRPDQTLWCKTEFVLAKNYKQNNEKLRLHFGAVDWQCELWINHQYVGKHCGGHDAFYFDIENFLVAENVQHLCIAVWDPCSAGVQPRGKQSNRPSNIYYKAVTGIWQSVWLEPLATTHIEYLSYRTDIHKKNITLTLDINDLQTHDEITVQVFNNEKEIAKKTTQQNQFQIQLPEQSKLWSPENPTLYPALITIVRNTKTIDSVTTYFSLRKIEIKKSADNLNRVYLNEEPVFQLGLLDQGWWPDGLYTAPNDAALKFDIEISKAMGFNMIRKHVKVEPARWYYHCDKIGMLVWQDMPTGDKNILPKQKDMKRSETSSSVFHQELDAMIKQLRFFQCIVCWVPFNEGWGQFETNSVLQKVKALDADRLVDGPSGWNDRGFGDFRDYHIYNRKLFIGQQKPGRAEAIGEFGGIGHRIAAHMAVTNSWSYNNTKTPEKLAQRYQNLLLEQMLPLIDKGLCAAVYTQTTDVESEINGLLTYDRKVEKIPVTTLAEIHQKVFRHFNNIV